MWTFKWLRNLSLLMFSFCLLFGRVDSTGPKVASVQAATVGPGSGGGGDYAADEPATDQDVISAIRKGQILAPFVLASLESFAVEARAVGSAKIFGSRPDGIYSIKKDVFDSLFPWPRKADDVFVRLARIQVVIKDQECIDGLENEKAASSFPYDSDLVCMSLPLIRAKSTKANVLRRVTALIIHELSHKMGVGRLAANHEESVNLEKVVDEGIPAEPFALLQARVTKLARLVRIPDGPIAERLDQALTELRGQRDWGRICFALGSLDASGSSIGRNYNETNGYMLAIVRKFLQAEEESIKRRTERLSGYCEPEIASRAVQTRAINLGGNAVLSLSSGVLRKPGYHDAATLKFELQDIQSSLSKILTGVLDAQKSLSLAEPSN